MKEPWGSIEFTSGVARIFQWGVQRGVDNQVGVGDKWGGVMKFFLKIQIEMVAFEALLRPSITNIKRNCS